MSRLKIAYVVPGLTISGGIGVVFQHTNRLLKRGHSVIVATIGEVMPVEWFPDQNVPVTDIRNLPDDLDILVATHWSTSYYVIQLQAKHKCYFVQSDETRFHEKGTEMFYVTHLSYLLNLHFLTEAKWIQNWLLTNFNKKAALVPNGLDHDMFHQTKPVKNKNTKTRVLLEGPINAPLKGMKEAFEVVQDLDVEVWCVSPEGKPEPHWKCDRYFNSVPMNNMKEIYSSCDILLKLSRMEGFFGPPLEMMACGGACVVGKVTGYDEYIIDEENALVVNPQDITAAKRAMNRLISDKNLREKLIDNGFKTAAQWQWEASVDALETYLHEIVDGKQQHITPTMEITNQAIYHLQNKASHEVPLFSHEKIAKKLTDNKMFRIAAEKLYYFLMKFKSNE